MLCTALTVLKPEGHDRGNQGLVETAAQNIAHLALHDEVVDGRQVVRRGRVRHRLLLEGRGDQRRRQRRRRRCCAVVLRMLPRADLCTSHSQVLPVGIWVLTLACDATSLLQRPAHQKPGEGQAYFQKAALRGVSSLTGLYCSAE